MTEERFVGTARLERGVWYLTAQPHVVIRLKRTFPRIDTRQHGVIKIRDTAEVCRELEWFSERFPLRIEPLDYLRRRSSSHKELEVSITRLMSGQLEPVEFQLAKPAREYQRVASDLALRVGGLLVADDVGLGKTVIAIACLTDPRTRPALVVTLTHLPGQWVEKLAEFAPGLKTHVLKSAQPYELPAGTDVIVSNYHKLSGWAETLHGQVRGIVYDECQELRHAGTKRWEAAHWISQGGWFRVGLSATPVYNYGGEMYSVLECLRPGALGERTEFINEWCINGPGDKPRIEEPRAFGTFLREQGLMIRRTREEVKRELPPLAKVPHTIDTDDDALKAVAADVAELARTILAQGVHGAEKRQAAGELDWRLRQATGIAKARFVATFVQMLVEAGERVVLYGWHREVYSIWQSSFAEARIEAVLYTGTEDAAAKARAAGRFTSGDAKVLIMSLRAGAGLDGLQHVTRTVVFGELDWSPGVHEQAIGRVFRDGQRDPVTAYFLLSESGSDPVLAGYLGVKSGQIQGIRDPNADLIETLEIDENRMKRLAEDVLRRRTP